MSRDGIPPEDTKYGRCEALARSSGDRCGRAAIGPHGKCGYHGGKTPTKDENPDVGAAEQNTNARTHGLHMKRDGYTSRQDDEDQEWIYELTESLVDMWRRRHGDKPPKAIRNRLESIAIDMHRVAWADAYFADKGLTQMRKEVVGDETITAEKLNLWASEIRHYNDSIEKCLDKHGLLDPPEDRDGSSLSPGTVFESDDYIIEVTDDELEDQDQDSDDDDESGSDSEEWVLEYESPDESSGDDADADD